MTISSFYKYCPIHDDSSLEKEYSIINLLSNQVKFSTRKNFNDLFDSKVDLLKPTKKDLKQISLKLSTSKRKEFKSKYYNELWEQNITQFTNDINKLFDRYLFYCVTDKSKSNLMWSHYANSHKGFCIEWDADKIRAEKVHYKSDIASFELLDFVKMHCGLISWDTVSNKIWLALRTKLDEWEYESEYRFQMSDQMEHLITLKDENFTLVKTEQSWIQSIIWGHRTSDKTREYIKKNLPQNMAYKQAYPGKNKIQIKDL